MRRGRMTGENGPSTTDHHEHDPRRRIARGDSNALIQGLERLRECVEGRLEGLERAARERAAPPAMAPSELEQRLQQRIAEHEEAQLHLRTLADRRDQEWQAALE